MESTQESKDNKKKIEEVSADLEKEHELVSEETEAEQEYQELLKEQDESDLMDKTENRIQLDEDEDEIQFSDEEVNKLGIIVDGEKKKSELTHSQKMKKRIKKEKRTEAIKNKKSLIKKIFTNPNLYKGISLSLDFMFNVASIVALSVSVYYTIYFLISENPIMVLVSCLVVWLLVKLNDKIQ